MNDTFDQAHHDAFIAYVRYGTPYRYSLVQSLGTSQYVWRTQRDEKVRLSHRMNDGRVFSWANPPESGHPGTDYNCRCEAVPYVRGETEFADWEFTTSLASSYDRWTNWDFVVHYYTGRGRGVDLLEIGHLREIAEQYAFLDKDEGAFRRLVDQIARKARGQGGGAITHPYGDSYEFEGVAFSHGGGTVEGEFRGNASAGGDMFLISGDAFFDFSDVFADPLDIGIEPGGTPYPVNGRWTATLHAEILIDATKSEYG